MPSAEVEASLVENGISLLDLLAQVKLIPSKGEGRRLIAQGGISVNDEKITDIGFAVTNDCFKDGKMIVKKGKKSFLKILVK